MDSFADAKEEIVGERRVFEVRCDAMLVDLRGCEQQAPQLKDRDVQDRAYLTYRYSPKSGRVRVERAQGRPWLTIAPLDLY